MRSTGWVRQAAGAGIAIVALALTTFVALPAGAADCGCTAAPESASRLLELANQARAAAGVAPLAMRGDVTAIAQGHSDAMASEGDIRHNDAYFTASTRQSLNAKSLGENVAMNPDIDDAHNRLMNSPGHRANILDPKYTVVGIAVSRTGDGQHYITQNFVEPKPAAAPAPAPAPAPAKPAVAAPAAPAPKPAPAPVVVEAAPVVAVETVEPTPAATPEAATPAVEVPVALAADRGDSGPKGNLMLLGGLASLIAIGLAATAISVRHSLS